MTRLTNELISKNRESIKNFFEKNSTSKFSQADIFDYFISAMSTRQIKNILNYFVTTKEIKKVGSNRFSKYQLNNNNELIDNSIFKFKLKNNETKKAYILCNRMNEIQELLRADRENYPSKHF